MMPSILDNEAKPFTEKDYKLLAKLTQVEAGYESYEGQLAVANVILNRVKDSRFPSTIHDVIYSGKQFPAAHNGKLDKSVPNASVLRAAKDALNGKNNVENAIYFFNPDVSKGSFWSSLNVVTTMGNHSFAK
ncbi:Spore cortex-lytic enzyme precursor [compost metagenome]